MSQTIPADEVGTPMQPEYVASVLDELLGMIQQMSLSIASLRVENRMLRAALSDDVTDDTAGDTGADGDPAD